MCRIDSCSPQLMAFHQTAIKHSLVAESTSCPQVTQNGSFTATKVLCKQSAAVRAALSGGGNEDTLATRGLVLEGRWLNSHTLEHDAPHGGNDPNEHFYIFCCDPEFTGGLGYLLPLWKKWSWELPCLVC